MLRLIICEFVTNSKGRHDALFTYIQTEMCGLRLEVKVQCLISFLNLLLESRFLYIMLSYYSTLNKKVTYGLFYSTSVRIIGWTEKVKRSSLVWLPYAW